MISPFLEEVFAFVKQYLPQKAAQLAFRVKVAVIELLTNGIKHCGDGTTEIELLAGGDQLTIIKTDSGKPLILKQGDEQLWPVTPAHPNPVKIYADALNGLFARALSATSLTFYTEEYPPDTDFADISEHYGLMIISRASNRFTYEFDQKSGKNIFTVTIQADEARPA